MVSVEGILKKASEDEYKAQQLVTVQDKQIDLTYDLGHLAAFDTNRINFPTVRYAIHCVFLHFVLYQFFLDQINLMNLLNV